MRRKKSALLFVAAVVCLLFTFTIRASAGWIDSWYSQTTTNGPQYYQGQKRGYWSAGSFQVRSPVQSDYLVTATAPRLKAGCGGIDVLFGGFSLLNFDYLVTKFQRILQAAPAAAFDLALNVLCEPCSKTMKSLDSIVNSLNSMQLDECRGSRAVAAKILEPTTNWLMDPVHRDTARGELAGIQNDFMQSTGLGNLWKSLNDSTSASGGKPQMDMRQLIAGCPAEFKEVFGRSGSVIESLGAKMGSPILLSHRWYEASWATSKSISSAMPAPRCISRCTFPRVRKTTTRSVENLLTGEVYGRAAYSACAPVTDSNRNSP